MCAFRVVVLVSSLLALTTSLGLGGSTQFALLEAVGQIQMQSKTPQRMVNAIVETTIDKIEYVLHKRGAVSGSIGCRAQAGPLQKLMTFLM